ncbi:MAG: competence/damage-inducible protein CinA-like protein [Planctomycetota bacterium]|nr:competence/damage-inducible protein CinA-like protein [Planctomycetota bacterium]
MHAEIIAVGSELVSGQKLDTNSQWLSLKLGDLGIPTHFHTTLGDDLDENIEAFRVAKSRAGLVIVTGGLGPTQDDLTREALARSADQALVEDAQALAAIEAFFARRNRTMTPRNRVQALQPEGAEPIANPVGTAPGIWMKTGGTIFACLPGVPSEMKVMFDGEVVPRLKAANLVGRVIVHRVINLFGKGESDIEAEALELTARGRLPEVGITASDATISFRISSQGANEEEARLGCEATADLIYDRFGDLIVGEGSEDVAHGLVSRLRSLGLTLAVAESCTGGLVAERLTRIPGVSDVFQGGVVSYANTVKIASLGVPADLLERFGAVSPQVAEAMARGVQERLRADLGISITGIAGPGGGSPEKPVGLVYIGLATRGGVQSRKLELGPEQPREIIRSRAAKHAMNFARLHLSR